MLRGWGLRIESALPLPGAQPAAGAEAPDIRVETGQATLAGGGEDVELGPYRLRGGSLLFTMPGVARFLAHRGGALLTVEPEQGADAELLSAMLVATALPAVLWMRGGVGGEMLLHAAAAVPAGAEGAIAFAGSSGSGKSTLLRHLLDAGAEAVAEDSLRVQLAADGPLTVSGLPGSLNLRPGIAPPEPARTRIPIPLSQQRSEAPLGALIVLEGAAAAAPARLHGADALAALLRHLHRPRIPRLLGQTPALLPRLARLASAIPVYSWNPQGKIPPFRLADLQLPAAWADEGQQ